MKKIFLFIFLLLIFFVVAIFFYARPQLEKNIEQQISDFGFKNAEIKTTSIHMNGLNIEKIQLDKDGFDYIQNIRIKLFWPKYLIKKNIKDIVIDSINFSSTSGDLMRLSKTVKTADLTKINSNTIEIKQITWDISTDKGAIRIEGKSNVTREDDTHKITAEITAKQYQLSFTSKWSGSFDKDNNVQIDGSINQLSINYAPLGIHRGTAWVSYINDGGATSSLSGQLDSGSGSIYKIPAKNIALTVGKEENYYPIIFRAQASGIDNVNMSTDIHYAKDAKDQAFAFNLNVKKPNEFFDYLKKLKIIEKTGAINIDENTDLTIQYMPDKRFADGPIPFDLRVKDTNAERLNGTFLIYPTSLDLRGTATGSKGFIKSLPSIFDIKDKEISDEVLHIDGNLKSLIQ